MMLHYVIVLNQRLDWPLHDGAHQHGLPMIKVADQVFKLYNAIADILSC